VAQVRWAKAKPHTCKRGDDPHDQQMIKDGFKYYNDNKENLKQPEEE